MCQSCCLELGAILFYIAESILNLLKLWKKYREDLNSHFAQKTNELARWHVLEGTPRMYDSLSGLVNMCKIQKNC